MTSTYVPAIPTAVATRSAAVWLLVLGAMLFLVAFEQGTVTADVPLLQEAFHDARHLLGFPRH